MQSAQADRERFVDFETEFLAGNLPVFWSFIRIEQHVVLRESERGGKCDVQTDEGKDRFYDGSLWHSSESCEVIH